MANPHRPESVTVVEFASLRRRLAAMVYEGIILLAVLSITFLVPHIALGLTVGISTPGWLLIVHIFMVLGLYFVWYWRHGGQTLAMQTWKIRIASANGSTPSTRRLIVRYVLAWPSLIYFCIGLLWALFDRDRQFLHDRLVGTRVFSTI